MGESERCVKIATLENEMEASLLNAILVERNIPHMIKSYHDIAYDGIFQTARGWGYVGSLESYRQEILEILSDIKKTKIWEEDL